MTPHPFRDYLLDEDGNIFNKRTFEKIEPTGGEYLSVESVFVHVLVAETFYNYEIGSGLTVNHKDGDKLNNKRDNLEVVTYSENITHAYKTGLRPDNKVVLVKDLRDDKVRSYYSVNECARHFGINASKITYALRSCASGKIWNRFYLIIEEGSEWPDYNKDDIGKFLNGYSKPLLATDLKTGVKTIYISLNIFSKVMANVPGNLYYRLKKAQRKNDVYTLGDLKLAMLDEMPEDLTDYEVCDERHKRPDLLKGFRKPIPVIVRTDESNERFESLKSFCDKHEFSFDAVAKSVYKHGKYKGYEIDYDRPLVGKPTM